MKLSSVTVNCPDNHQLAEFYATITGGDVTFEHPSWATVMSPGGRIDLQRVSDYVPPEWPQAVGLIHLDFLVDDLAENEALVLQAGATRLEEQPNVEHCLMLTDPARHPFCLTTVEELG